MKQNKFHGNLVLVANVSYVFFFSFWFLGDNDKISSEQPLSELIKEFNQLMITKDGPHQKIANIIAELAKTGI